MIDVPMHHTYTLLLGHAVYYNIILKYKMSVLQNSRVMLSLCIAIDNEDCVVFVKISE